MPEQTSSKESLFKSLLQTLASGLATRIQIAQMELSAARSHSAKLALYTVICAVIGVLALAFVSMAVLALFWDDHKELASCCIAAFYVALFIYFLVKAIRLGSSMPPVLTETKQILINDVEALSRMVSSTSENAEPGPEDEENAEQ